MKQGIARTLVRIARWIDPNSAVDFTPLPTGPAVINISTMMFDDERNDSANVAVRDLIHCRMQQEIARGLR